MKIGHIMPQSISKKQKTKAALPPSKEQPGENDTVKISSKAMSALSMSKQDGVREAKLQELKQQIKAGTYKVDDEDVARAILSKINFR